jgi:hypothetical protein
VFSRSRDNAIYLRKFIVLNETTIYVGILKETAMGCFKIQILVV